MLPPTNRRELFALKKGSKMAELLEVKNLSVSFDTPDGEAEAVRDVSFFVKKGETLAIVGESGCGKSVLCRSIMKLLPKTARIKSGSVLLDGKEITGLTEKEMQKLRGNSFSMVFQDPMTTLNPVFSRRSQTRAPEDNASCLPCHSRKALQAASLTRGAPCRFRCSYHIPGSFQILAHR